MHTRDPRDRSLGTPFQNVRLFERWHRPRRRFEGIRDELRAAAPRSSAEFPCCHECGQVETPENRLELQAPATGAVCRECCERRAGVFRLAARELAALVLVLLVAAPALAQSNLSPVNWTVTFVDSQEVGYEGKQAIDGNPATLWATPWISGVGIPPPHEIAINMNETRLLSAFGYLGRQDGEQNGRVSQYEFYTSNDSQTWMLQASGTFPNSSELQIVSFKQPTYARFVKFRELSEVNGMPWLAVAEISLYEASNTTTLRPGEQFVAVADHDGVCATGYRLYLDGAVISTLPVASLVGGTISLPGVIKVAGNYQIRISAFAQMVAACGDLTDEKFSETLFVVVTPGIAPPSQPRITKPAGAAMSPPDPGAPPAPTVIRAPFR